MSGPVRSFASRLGRLDHAVTAVPEEGPGAEVLRAASAVDVLGHTRIAMPSGRAELIEAALASARDVALLVGWLHRQRARQVVVVTTYVPAAIVASWLLGLPLVVYCAELLGQSRDARRSKRLVARWLLTLTDRASDHVVCCSELCADQFAALASPAERPQVIYPSIATAGAPPRPTSTRDARTIVTLGALTPGRGQDLAIAALAHLRDRGVEARLAIGGEPGFGADDDSYARGLRDQASALDVAHLVDFAGHVADPQATLAAATVCLCPARFDEPFGRVPYEALAAGTPPVVTRTGASPELLVDGVSALLVDVDAEDMADALQRLLDEPSLGRALVAGSSSVLSRVGAEVSDAAFLELLDGAPPSRSAARRAVAKASRAAAALVGPRRTTGRTDRRRGDEPR